MLSRGEESCGEVGLNSGFSGFFMVGDDMSGQRVVETNKQHRSRRHRDEKDCGDTS